MERIIGALVAIALAILAISSVLGNSDQARSDQKGGNLATNVSFIMTKARAGFSQGNTGYANFSNANVVSLINAGVFPQSMVKNNAIFDAWGNGMVLGSANNNANGVITFGGGNAETTDECVTTVMSLNGYDSLTVNGTVFTSANKPDESAAGGACTATAPISVTFH